MKDHHKEPLPTWGEKRAIHHLPSVKEMELFVNVVREGSFSAAGRLVGLSPASVSRHINAAEDRLGIRLFNRSSRKLSLTDGGQVFYRHCIEMLQQMHSLLEEVTSTQEEAVGTVHVRAMMMVGQAFIRQAVAEFQLQYPKITIDLMFSNDMADIVEENIDVDIRIGYLQDSSLIARKLKASERRLCATPEYLARGAAIHAPNDLRHHNCLAYRTNRGAVTWRFRDHEGVLTEVPVSGSLLTNSGDVLYSVTLAGNGVGLLPDWAIDRDVAEGRLAYVLPDYKVSFAEFENDIFAVYSSSRYLPARTRVFLDFLVNFFRQNPQANS